MPSLSGQGGVTHDWLMPDLHHALLDLYNLPFTPIKNPPNCKRRAAVACIIRVRPVYPDVPVELDYAGTENTTETLSKFFQQPWVTHGEPEILFIKRAAQPGDRFTGHVALPGGKQDGADASDEATAVRETAEEIGLDLHAPGVVAVGPLPERIVTTEWGTVPLMVLCPFVYLATRFALPPLRLQPCEVASAHWVPIDALLEPALHTHERADVADRLARRHGSLVKILLRCSLGQMLYAGVRLLPSESTFVPPGATALPDGRPLRWTSRGFIEDRYPERQLLLWGLTHGIIADLLGMLHHQEQPDWWFWWPTLSAPDVRLAIWLLSYRFRQRKMHSLQSMLTAAPSICAVDTPGHSSSPDHRYGSKTALPDDRTMNFPESPRSQQSRVNQQGGPGSAVIYLLDGYYACIKRAVFLIAFLRLAVVAAALSSVATGGRGKGEYRDSKLEL